MELEAKYPDCLSFLMGDFNARTAKDFDFIINDSIDHIPIIPDSYEEDTFNIERNSKDLATNAFGKKLLELCRDHDIHFLNGRSANDKEGNFTCIANRGTSVVDYMIASSELFNFITDFTVEEKSDSDHFPLTCTLNFETNHKVVEPVFHPNLKKQSYFKWDKERPDVFKINLCSEEGESRIKELFDSDRENVSECMSKLYNLLNWAATEYKSTKHFGQSSKRQHNTWFNHECEVSKQRMYRALRRFRTINNAETLK